MSDLFDTNKSNEITYWEEMLAELQNTSVDDTISRLKQTAWESLRGSERFDEVADLEGIANIYSQVVSDELYKAITTTHPDIEATFTRHSNGRVSDLKLRHESFLVNDFEAVDTQTEYSSFLHSLTGYNAFYDILQEIKTQTYAISNERTPTGLVTTKVLEQDLEPLIEAYKPNYTVLADILETNEYYDAETLPELARTALGAGLLLKAVLDENLSACGLLDKIDIGFNNKGLRFILTATTVDTEYYPLEELEDIESAIASVQEVQ